MFHCYFRFISMSSPGDLESAPEGKNNLQFIVLTSLSFKGYRAMMISTHCQPEPWIQIKSAEEYEKVIHMIAIVSFF